MLEPRPTRLAGVVCGLVRADGRRRCGAFHAGRRAGFVLFAALGFWATACTWGGKVKLERKYRLGQKTVYESTIKTRLNIHSTPEGLRSFLPPFPTELSLWQRNTITVRGVRSDGAVDVEYHFDQFKFQSNLLEQMPEELRDSARQAQAEFVRRVIGQTLVVHYDREGKLVEFEGGEEVFRALDAPWREPLRQVLKFMLAQTSGSALYPGRAVKRGEEWEQNFSSQPTDLFPFSSEGESNLKYVGKSNYHRVKAATVDYRFTDSLKPEFAGLNPAGPLAQLKTMGMQLEIVIAGQGQGRAILARDDGRVLQDHSTIRQTLKARLQAPPRANSPASGPITLEIVSETTLEVEDVSP